MKKLLNIRGLDLEVTLDPALSKMNFQEEDQSQSEKHYFMLLNQQMESRSRSRRYKHKSNLHQQIKFL